MPIFLLLWSTFFSPEFLLKNGICVIYVSFRIFFLQLLSLFVCEEWEKTFRYLFIYLFGVIRIQNNKQSRKIKQLNFVYWQPKERCKCFGVCVCGGGESPYIHFQVNILIKKAYFICFSIYSLAFLWHHIH